MSWLINGKKEWTTSFTTSYTTTFDTSYVTTYNTSHVTTVGTSHVTSYTTSYSTSVYYQNGYYQYPNFYVNTYAWEYMLNGVNAGKGRMCWGSFLGYANYWPGYPVGGYYYAPGNFYGRNNDVTIQYYIKRYNAGYYTQTTSHVTSYTTYYNTSYTTTYSTSNTTTYSTSNTTSHTTDRTTDFYA